MPNSSSANTGRTPEDFAKRRVMEAMAARNMSVPNFGGESSYVEPDAYVSTRSNAPVSAAAPNLGPAHAAARTGSVTADGRAPTELNSNDIYNGFMDTVRHGVTLEDGTVIALTNPYALAVVAGTGQRESTWDPKRANLSWSDPSKSGKPGKSGGIMSWRNSRLDGLYTYAAKHGEKQGAISPQTQAGYFLTENPRLTARLEKAKSLEEAQSLINNTWAFAGYDEPGGTEVKARFSASQSYLPRFQNGGGSNGAAVPPAGNVASPAGNPAPQAGSVAPQAGSVAPQAGNSAPQVGGSVSPYPRLPARVPIPQPRPGDVLPPNVDPGRFFDPAAPAMTGGVAPSTYNDWYLGDLAAPAGGGDVAPPSLDPGRFGYSGASAGSGGIAAPTSDPWYLEGLNASADTVGNNDDSELNTYLSDPARVATLPAGMRNNNPGNIKYIGQKLPGLVGPSVNTDQGDPQVVFDTPESGMRAMYRGLARKYAGGKLTPNQIIGDKMGWTPGNYKAAENVAKTLGIRPDDDICFNDPDRAAKFMRALILQEHGEKGGLYSDSMISSAIGAGVPSTGTRPSALPLHGPVPQPRPSVIPAAPPSSVAQPAVDPDRFLRGPAAPSAGSAVAPTGNAIPNAVPPADIANSPGPGSDLGVSAPYYGPYLPNLGTPNAGMPNLGPIQTGPRHGNIDPATSAPYHGPNPTSPGLPNLMIANPPANGGAGMQPGYIDPAISMPGYNPNAPLPGIQNPGMPNPGFGDLGSIPKSHRVVIEALAGRPARPQEFSQPVTKVGKAMIDAAAQADAPPLPPPIEIGPAPRIAGVPPEDRQQPQQPGRQQPGQYPAAPAAPAVRPPQPQSQSMMGPDYFPPAPPPPSQPSMGTDYFPPAPQPPESRVPDSFETMQGKLYLERDRPDITPEHREWLNRQIEENWAAHTPRIYE